MVFPVPESPYIEETDMIILDGRKVGDVPIYSQGPNITEKKTISGGNANGNGIAERGESVLIYIRLPQGMGPNDTHTFHRTYLINHSGEAYIRVEQLDYQIRLRQAATTSISTLLTLSDDAPDNHELDLWFAVESLYNDHEDPTSDADIHAYKFDYRRVRLTVNPIP